MSNNMKIMNTMHPREAGITRSTSLPEGTTPSSHSRPLNIEAFKSQVPLAAAASTHTAAAPTAVADRVKELQNAAVDNTRNVDPAVVDKLKKSAGTNVGIAVALGLFFAATVAAAVFTGGFAIPMAAVAGVIFMVAAADAGTVLYNWWSKKQGGEELPMKGDSIGNLYYLMARCIQSVTGKKDENGLSDSTKKYISWASGASRFMLGAASIVLGGVNTVISASTIAAATMVVPALNNAGRAVIECVQLSIFVRSAVDGLQTDA